MARANGGLVRLNYGCWGLTITPHSTPLKSAATDIKFMMSVPKRLLRLSVWRNQARRVARESWRAANRQSSLTTLIGAQRAHEGAPEGFSIMLRLAQKPIDRLSKTGAPASKSAPAPVIGAGQIKAVLRSDCDQLLAQLQRRLS